MFDENNEQLDKAAGQVVADMVAAGVACKKIYTDSRVGKDYFNLTTADAFEKDLVVIVLSGYPEQTGVWSYTLVSDNRIDESSMEPYFTEFAAREIGLVVINPNCLAPDIEGDSFVYQLEKVIADIAPDKKIGLIGFSMGGKVLVDFIEQRPELLSRIAGLVLIDPTLPNRLKTQNIRQLLDKDTLLIASQGQQHCPGEIAAILLEIEKISFEGIHGQMPNKALKEVLKFYAEKMH